MKKLDRRTFMTVAGASLCGLLLPRDGMVLSNVEHVDVDSAHGMFAMAAYGDALGASNESSGSLAGECFDPNTCRMGGTGESKTHPWGYWALDPEGPMVTDDTAFRTMILQPYLLERSRTGESISEEGLLAWMKSARASKDEAFGELRSTHIEQWFRMHEVAELGEEFLFYTPGESVVFGPYVWLEATPFEARASPIDTFSMYHGRCSLDQGVGRSFTGVLAAMTASAARSRPSVRGTFHEWFAHFIDHLTGAVLDAEHEASVEMLDLAQARMAAEARARGWHHDDARAFVRHVRRTIHQDRKFSSMKQHHYTSELFWMLMCAAVAFGREDDALTLRVLASSAGDCDTMASMMGVLMGAYYGREMSGRLIGLDGPLETELGRVEHVLKTRFDVDLAARANTLVRGTRSVFS